MATYRVIGQPTRRVDGAAKTTGQVTTVLVESAHGVGPYHIKGIGESPLTPVAPAIANAVADAVGIRLRDLPMTAEKVYRALQEHTQR
jgi:CO/xanthine dehydrogenase Mo-binding subunit